MDIYIRSCPKATRSHLKKIRQCIRTAAPKAEECISYKMAAYKLNGMLVYFAAHRKHAGFYPGVAAIAAFKKELSPYKSAKGSVQFPYETPVPLALLSKMVKFKLRWNLARVTRAKA